MSLHPPVAIVGLLVAFSLPAIGFYRGRRTSDELDWRDLRRGLLRSWAILAVLVVLAVRFVYDALVVRSGDASDYRLPADAE